MASIVEICNGALNQLGASTILTLTDDSNWFSWMGAVPKKNRRNNEKHNR